MADSDQNHRSVRPSRIPERFSVPAPSVLMGSPSDSEPPSSSFNGDDFLFHLSRGSELLKDNEVERAKEELELALGVQPRDPRGQGLLGVVYFRLGLYPRAIDIFKQLVASCPDDVTPKINLALCYLKTGQLSLAQDLLTSVVATDPEHRRAWSYLGLVFQFQQDFRKAKVAFERAEQTAMARRMDQLEQQLHQGPDECSPPERWELRRAAEHAVVSFDKAHTPFSAGESAGDEAPVSRSGRWHAMEPGDAAIPGPARLPRSTGWSQSSPPPAPSTPPPPSATEGEPRPQSVPPVLSSPTLVVGSEASPQKPAVPPTVAPPSLGEWVVSQRVDLGSLSTALLDASTLATGLVPPYGVRASAIVSLSPAALARHELPVVGRSRKGSSDEIPVGGRASPIVGFVGPGRLIARLETGILTLVELFSDFVSVVESHLFGMSLDMDCEVDRLMVFGRDPLSYVQLSGTGPVAISTRGPARTVGVGDEGLVVQMDMVVAWVGRVVVRPLDAAEAPGRARGFLAFSGEGWVLLA
jgi:hypothetical protein